MGSFPRIETKDGCMLRWVVCLVWTSEQQFPSASAAKWITYNQAYSTSPEIEGILPKGPYQPCLRMADRDLLAGYPRNMSKIHALFWLGTDQFTVIRQDTITACGLSYNASEPPLKNVDEQMTSIHQKLHR